MAKKLLLFVSMTLLAAGSAVADVKVYDSTPPTGTPGDVQSYVSTNCPPLETTPGVVWGEAVIEDTGSGTVTLDSLLMRQTVLVVADLVGGFGPGAFLFLDADTSITPGPAQTASGSTAQGGGTVTWGVLGGWTQTGPIFCRASPTINCGNFGFGPHGVTLSPNIASSTYDLGTWTFDAAGDYDAPPYIVQTYNGGTANAPFVLRGRFVGASLPMLPLVGMGALAAGLLFHGVSVARRKK